MENDEPQSLSSAWSRSEKLRNELETSRHSFNSDVRKQQLTSAIDALARCRNLVDQLSLFSLNESLDDVSTNDMKFLSVDFHLGELLSKQNPPGGPAARAGVLGTAKKSYRRFLTLCDAYDILSTADRELFERTGEEAGSKVFSAHHAGDAGKIRLAKIAKYKEEKELKAKVEMLSNSPNPDEEHLRSLQLANINLHVMQTFSALESIALEMEILAQAPSPAELAEARRKEEQMQEDARQRMRRSGMKDDDYSEKVDPSEVFTKASGRPLLSSDGKPLRPFTLLDSRSKLKAQVFGPGHRLPTMTIDEYLDEEKKRGGIIEGGGEKSGQQPEPDEDNMELADQETMKAREWDEFKEANPRGSGNTMNRG